MPSRVTEHLCDTSRGRKRKENVGSRPLRGGAPVEWTLTPPVPVSVARGASRGDHGGPDEEGRQQPRPHHLRGLR